MKIKFIGRTVQRLKKEFVTAQKLNDDSTSLKAYGKIPGKTVRPGFKPGPTINKPAISHSGDPCDRPD